MSDQTPTLWSWEPGDRSAEYWENIIDAISNESDGTTGTEEDTSGIYDGA
jgi:hypothetical protein